MTVFYLLFALLTPWALGFAIVRALMKKRYGQTAFALGGGYLLGMFFISAILAWSGQVDKPVNINLLFVFIWLVTLPLLFFLSPRPCSMEELRLEKAPSNIVYGIGFLIIIVLVYRWGLTALDRLNQPFQLTELGLDVLTKAKVFYYQQSFPDTEALVMLGSIDKGVDSVGWLAQWDLVPLIQSYMAMSLGSWDERILELPWLILNVALALSVFGGLRYLGAGLLPAVLSAYLISSLPLLDEQLSIGGYVDTWGAVALLLAVFSWIIVLVYQEWRFLILFFFFFVNLCLSNMLAIAFAMVFLVLLLWRLLNLGLFSLLSLVVLGLFFLAFKVFFSSDFGLILDKLLFNTTRFFTNPEIGGHFIQGRILEDNWHFLFLASVLVFFVLLAKGKYHRQPCGFLLLVVAAFAVFLITLGVIFLIHHPLWLNNSRIIAFSLYFVLLYALLVACAYEIVLAD